MIKFKDHMFENINDGSRLTHAKSRCCKTEWQNLHPSIIHVITSIEDLYDESEGYAGLTVEELMVKLGYGEYI